MLKASPDDSTGLCYEIRSLNINISKLLSIVVMIKVAISATLKILNSCNDSIKVKLNIVLLLLNPQCHLCTICMPVCKK